MPIVGIDLGTTFSLVAMMDETGRPRVIHNKDGANLTPSVVVGTGEEAVEVGTEFARRHWGVSPKSGAARFKRDMGSSAKFTVNAADFTPTQLSVFVLRKLKADAEATIGPITEAVVTIPANFPHEAREATMAAAKAAGLSVKYIINEPTAAALYYAFKGDQKLRGSYAVYDLGGGTFDISVIEVNGQDVDVIATNGVARLGGDDFDTAMQRIVQRKYRAATGAPLDEDEFTKNDAEEEKKSLSSRTKVRFKVAREMIEVDRSEFEEAISPLIAQAEMLCEATLEDAGLDLSDLQGIFLAGGSTRIPFVQQSVRRVFGREPISTVNVDEVVALGAAVYAAYKTDRSRLSPVQQNAVKKISVTESTGKCFGTLSLGIDQNRERAKIVNTILIKKGEKIPCSVTESFYTVHEGQRAVGCQVTESTAPETDPQFVKEIWKEDLPLPAGRPAHQEIRVTFAYDVNQVMKCSFVDVSTGRKIEVDLKFNKAEETDLREIERFVVE